MRILPIALSVLMIFTPAYSAYASMLPTKGQIIAIGKKGGALIKTGAGVTRVTPVAIAVGLGVEVGKASIGAAITWCKNNQKKCKDKIGDLAELACDDASCIVSRTDKDTHIPDEYCMLYASEGSGYRYDLNEVAQFGMTKLKQRYPRNELVLSARSLSAMQKYTKQIFEKRELVSNQYYIVQVMEKNGNLYQDASSDLYIYYTIQKNDNCDPGNARADSEENRKKLLDEVAKKIINNMDDDDIKNYYNTDYDDITINNYHYYGDDIDRETNIDKYCESNACHEISKEIEKDIANKKYDIDDVTPENCTIEESTGKYIACSITINNEEENTQTPPKDDTDQTTTPKKEDEEEEPYLCGTTDLTKKICSFLDWSKSGDYDDEDDKVKIKESEEDKPNTKVEFTGTCPAPYEIDISLDAGFMGTIDYDFVLLDTPKLCTFLDDWVEPIVYVLGPLHAIYILGGNRENV